MLAPTATAGRTLHRWLRDGELPPPTLEIVVAAQAAGLTGVLQRAVQDTWPAGEACDALRDATRRIALRTTLQLEAAAQAIALIAAAGLRALPLKGAAVAESLYPSVGERPMADVDILALDDWAGSTAALAGGGFVVVERVDHAWVFRRSEILVELHRGFTSCPRLHPIDREGLWSRSVLRRGTQVARAPSTEDLLVQIGLHAAFQHGLSLSLIQYLDMRRLLDLSPDVGLLVGLASATRAGRAVATALIATEAVTGCVLPEACHRWIDRTLPASWRFRVADWGVATERRAMSLVRLRWMLSAGHRSMLLRDTLAPDVPGVGRPGFQQILRRLAGLAGRHTA